MKKRIEKPKIFISYAWGDEEYQGLVLAFAEKLVGDGIDVILDRWDLTEGNDTYAFMEKSVNDTSITNVLMLLDPIYAQKADGHKGGVGTETQIISAKVYQEVSQDKFIPIVMKRDEEGNVCKPTYLQGRLHFDLSDPEKYDAEYTRLVKKLYGVEVFEKPQLGSKPDWVDKPMTLPHKNMVAYESLKKQTSDATKQNAFSQYLNEIKDLFIVFASQQIFTCNKGSEYISLYNETADIREKYLLLLSYSSYVNDAPKMIADFLEETYNAADSLQTITAEIVRIRIHELFIYTIAFYLKIKAYLGAGYLLGKTYFTKTGRYHSDGAESFHLFYSATGHDKLDRAINERDNQRYYSGTAQYWIETIANEFCTKEQFILADLICFNYSVYGDHTSHEWPWFPLTYIYDSRNISLFADFAKRLVSREFDESILSLWGFETLDLFKERFEQIHSGIELDELNKIRYNGCFNRPPLLGDYVEAKDIAKYK